MRGGNNWLSARKRADILHLLLSGQSVRQTAATVQCSKVTVSKYRKFLVHAELLGEPRLKLPSCACGKAAGHHGWCKVRYSKSTKRQEFMKTWQNKSARPTD